MPRQIIRFPILVGAVPRIPCDPCSFSQRSHSEKHGSDGGHGRNAAGQLWLWCRNTSDLRDYPNDLHRASQLGCRVGESLPSGSPKSPMNSRSDKAFFHRRGVGGGSLLRALLWGRSRGLIRCQRDGRQRAERRRRLFGRRHRDREILLEHGIVRTN